MAIKTIKINEINKLEGHISFQANLEEKNISQAKIKVEEGARLIEGILLGRNYNQAPVITARICGICPVVHNLTSIKALEDALEIKVSPLVVRLRKLMLCAQIIQSHALHLYFCSLPDFFKMTDNFRLLKKFPEEGKNAINIRGFANKIVEAIGGRAIHPINSVVGGFNTLPDLDVLREAENESEMILKKAENLAILFENLQYPKVSRKTEYISLSDKKEYAFYDGTLISNQKLKGIKAQKFFEHIKEIEAGNVEKRTEHNGHSYMIGALARVNNNNSKLNPKAKKIFGRNKKNILSYNSFYNILSQAVELVHFIEEARDLITEITKIKDSKISKDIHQAISEKAGRGASISEAPRGLLYHQYEIDKEGKIIQCAISTPTAQFLNNLEDDLNIYLEDKKNLSPGKIKFLIRAYDPCISCATH